MRESDDSIEAKLKHHSMNTYPNQIKKSRSAHYLARITYKP
jgi:hypothetical protein